MTTKSRHRLKDPDLQILILEDRILGIAGVGEAANVRSLTGLERPGHSVEDPVRGKRSWRGPLAGATRLLPPNRESRGAGR